MKRLYLLLCGGLALLGACSDAVGKLKETADATHTQAEHAEAANRASNTAREEKVYADARTIVRHQLAEKLAQSTGDKGRYDIRRDANGWYVYDSAAGTVARTKGASYSGLSEQKALETYRTLRQQDAEANSALSALHPQN
jgi:hypothetical protein